MLITYTGVEFEDSFFLSEAFFDNSDSTEGLDLISDTATQVVINNPDTGIRTTIAGSGLSLTGTPGNEVPNAGTITSFTMERGGTTIGQITNISWSFVDFSRALDAIETSGDLSQLGTLFNSSGPITIDASGGTTGFEMRDYFDFGPFGSELSDFITQPMTITGTGFNDFLIGGQGNDFINPGSNDDEGDTIIATAGNDTMNFGDAGDRSYYDVNYFRFDGINANLDFVTGTATVDKGGSNGTDTHLNVDTAVWGWSMDATNGDDTITANVDTDRFISVHGGRGSDTFNLTLNDSGFRLNHWSATQGIVANLANGTIEDGTGSTDSITVLGDFGTIEIRGTDFNDIMTGSNRSNERFITEQGNDTVDGGGGWDVLRYDRGGVGPVNVDLAAGTAMGTWDGFAFTDTIFNIEEVRGSRDGNDTLIGSDADERLEGRGGDDSIDGAGGNDTLRGDDGNDTLIGGDGRDNMAGGEGNDLLDASQGDASTQGFGDFIRPGLGNDTILGHVGHWNTGEGADLSYADLDVGVTINSGTNGTGTVTGAGLNDSFNYIHYFNGSQGADVINGASEDRWEGFQGFAGNDTINGGTGGGDNQINYDSEHFDGGSSGIIANLNTGIVTDTFGDTDTLININRLRGSVFDDSITAFGSTEGRHIRGEDGADTITGGAGEDTIRGNEGNDVLNGSGGIDWLSHFDSDAGVTANLQTGTVADDGYGSSDTVSNFENLYGSQHNDNLTGNTGANEMGGDAGNDTMNGAGGNDSMFGGDGDDRMDGGFGFDTLEGGAGRDVLLGGGNADRLYGDEGNDTLDGGVGTDHLFGGDGNDRLIAGADADRVDGGAGDDLIRAGTNFGGSVDGVDGGAGNDTIFGEGGFDLLIGGDGDDSIDGGAQADNLFGNAGNDTLDGGAGFDRLFGGTDDDLLMDFDGVGGLFGGFGNDTLLNGDDGNTFFAGSGNDLIEAGGGDDIVNGNAGFDTIDGGTGNDILRGQFNADIFLFADGHGQDTVTDFDASNAFEKLDFSEVSAITGLADLDLGSAATGAATQVGSDVLIDTGGGNSVLLLGVSLSDLDASDFVF